MNCTYCDHVVKAGIPKQKNNISKHSQVMNADSNN